MKYQNKLKKKKTVELTFYMTIDLESKKKKKKIKVMKRGTKSRTVLDEKIRDMKTKCTEGFLIIRSWSKKAAKRTF